MKITPVPPTTPSHSLLTKEKRKQLHINIYMHAHTYIHACTSIEAIDIRIYTEMHHISESVIVTSPYKYILHKWDSVFFQIWKMLLFLWELSEKSRSSANDRWQIVQIRSQHRDFQKPVTAFKRISQKFTLQWLCFKNYHVAQLEDKI